MVYLVFTKTIIFYTMSKLVFLDRDGVINYDSADYIKSAKEWLPIPGSIEAIVKLQKNNYVVFVITNQSGVSRGLFSLSELFKIHEKMNREIINHKGVSIPVFYCPHLPNTNCFCRKPKSGLITFAEALFSISAKGSFFVGDSLRDLDAAIDKQLKPVLVRTGNGSKLEKSSILNTNFDYTSIPIYNDLASFVDAVV